MDDYLNDKEDDDSSDSEYNGRADKFEIKDNESVFNGHSLNSRRVRSERTV